MEGPPKELFHQANGNAGNDDQDEEKEYDEEALRKYQLERLRYVDRRLQNFLPPQLRFAIDITMLSSPVIVPRPLHTS